jgi:hypothetical protein
MTRACRRCGETFDTNRSHHRYCWPCYWELRDGGEATPPAPPYTGSPSLEPGLLREAIALCHPDRHPPEQERANAVTAALLDLLTTVRKRGEAA